MPLSPEDVSRIAHLARLELSPAEGHAMLGQLNEFFGIVEQMSAVDTRGVEPLYTPLSAVQSVTLRLRPDEVTEGNDRMHVHTSGGGRVVVYVRPDHQPATFAVLNFPVADIDVAADRLLEAGVRFERFEGMHQDEWGIRRPDSEDDEPPMAWFRDPAGNLLSVMELAR